MEDLKALTECAECTWDYIDRLRMALAAACKERDEMKKELAAMRDELWLQVDVGRRTERRC